MKILIILLGVILFTGCTTAPIQIKSTPIKRIPLTIPMVDQYSHSPYSIIMITPSNAKKVFAKLQKKGKPIVLIGLTGEAYEIISLNNSAKMVLIKQLKAQLKAYKKYYIAVEEEISKQK